MRTEDQYYMFLGPNPHCDFELGGVEIIDKNHADGSSEGTKSKPGGVGHGHVMHAPVRETSRSMGKRNPIRASVRGVAMQCYARLILRKNNAWGSKITPVRAPKVE